MKFRQVLALVWLVIVAGAFFGMWFVVGYLAMGWWVLLMTGGGILFTIVTKWAVVTWIEES